MGPYLVGIDCGTQSAKVVIHDASGRPVARGQHFLRPMHRPRHGVAVHPDDDLWTSTTIACRDAMAGFTGDPRQIAGIGICPIRCCKAFLRADGTLVEPVISWMDDRAYQPYVPDSPDVAFATTTTGYLAHRLTGRRTDTAANNIALQWPIDTDTWQWSADPGRYASYGTTREQLFDLQMPGDVIGPLTAAAAAATGLPEGTPVVHTANDKAVEMLGAGSLGERTALVSRIAAERANRAKDEFLAVVSHELRTPLNAIAGWTRILRTHGLSDEARETALQKIDRNLRVQTEIVDELLSFSDVMSIAPGLHMRPVRIRRVIEDAIDLVSVSAFQKGITLDTELELGELKVCADRERLRMAIGNVISNAVKFTPSGGKINVTGRAADDEVRCIVTDDGVGISPDFLPHIFEKYTQSELASTRHFGGLGLGLTIAQHILKLHHGSIDAASTGAGGGSTFTIHIPLKRPASPAVR